MSTGGKILLPFSCNLCSNFSLNNMISASASYGLQHFCTVLLKKMKIISPECFLGRLFPSKSLPSKHINFAEQDAVQTRAKKQRKKKVFKSLIETTSQSSHNYFINWFSHQQGGWGGGKSYLRSCEPFPDKICLQRFNMQVWKYWPHEQRLSEEVLLLSLCTMASWTKFLDGSHPVFLHYSSISVLVCIFTK